MSAEALHAVSQRTHAVLVQFFDAVQNQQPPEQLAQLFTPDVDWLIPGDAHAAPWVGRKHGRAGIAEFFHQWSAHVTSERVQMHQVFVEGQEAVVTGHQTVRVLRTGCLIETEFALLLRVCNGLIAKYHLLQDSLAVHRAAHVPGADAPPLAGSPQ